MERFEGARRYTLRDVINGLSRTPRAEIESRFGVRFLVTPQLAEDFGAGGGVDLRSTLPSATAANGSAPGASRLSFTVHALGFDPKAPKPLIVGRDPSADLQLVNRTVSRQHAELSWLRGDLVVSDQYSLNGTYLDGDIVPLTGSAVRCRAEVGSLLLFGSVDCAIYDANRLLQFGAIALAGKIDNLANAPR